MKNDIVSLYQIIDKFSKEMYDLENLNITSVSSLSSITLKTYLTNYYNKNKTPIHIPRHVNYLDIKNAYFGGRVEVFKGFVENIYIYDVVSLYPSCMLKDLPIGNISKSTDNNIDNYYSRLPVIWFTTNKWFNVHYQPDMTPNTNLRSIRYKYIFQLR